MLGAIAHTNEFGLMPGVLFFVQFVWQFPHFWAIAWVIFDDYAKPLEAFLYLPSKGGRDRASAFQIISCIHGALIPFSLLPWILGWTSDEVTLIVAAVICSGMVSFIMRFQIVS